MSSKIRISRTNTPGARLSTTDNEGVPYVDFGKKQFGVHDSTGVPRDLVGVPFHSQATGYDVGDLCVYSSGSSIDIYQCILTHTAQAFNQLNWKNTTLGTEAENMIYNPDSTVNQREFDGNWAGVSNGTFGYDRWKKYNDVYKSQPLIVSDFRPSEYYTLSWSGGGNGALHLDGAAVSYATSPITLNTGVTGVNVAAVVPQGATDIRLVPGIVSLPVRKKSYIEEFQNCLAYYWTRRIKGVNEAICTGTAISSYILEAFFPLSTPMVRNPTIIQTGGTFGPYSGLTTLTFNAKDYCINMITLELLSSSSVFTQGDMHLVVDLSGGGILEFDAEI